MVSTRKGIVTNTRKGRMFDPPKFEASSELSFEKQLPQYAKPTMKLGSTEVSGSIRPSSYDLFPGE